MLNENCIYNYVFLLVVVISFPCMLAFFYLSSLPYCSSAAASVSSCFLSASSFVLRYSNSDCLRGVSWPFFYFIIIYVSNKFMSSLWSSSFPFHSLDVHSLDVCSLGQPIYSQSLLGPMLVDPQSSVLTSPFLGLPSTPTSPLSSSILHLSILLVPQIILPQMFLQTCAHCCCVSSHCSNSSLAPQVGWTGSLTPVRKPVQLQSSSSDLLFVPMSILILGLGLLLWVCLISAIFFFLVLNQLKILLNSSII